MICRQQALGIVQQLVLSTGGDDDMGTLLGLMHTAAPTALQLKTAILKVSVNNLVSFIESMYCNAVHFCQPLKWVEWFFLPLSINLCTRLCDC